MVHPGHIKFLKEAAKLGDELHVFLDSDKRNKELKGRKAIFSYNERFVILDSLQFVKSVSCYNGPDKEFKDKLKRLSRFWNALDYDQLIFVKAGDYTFDSLDQEEQSIIKNMGGITVLLDYDKSYSTTKIFEKIRDTMTDSRMVGFE